MAPLDVRPTAMVATSNFQALNYGVDITGAFRRSQQASDCKRGQPCCYAAGEGGATFRVTGHCYDNFEGQPPSYDEDRCAQSHVVVWDEDESVCEEGFYCAHHAQS